MSKALAKPISRHIAGAMTGTSLDGLDVVIAKIDGTYPYTEACMLTHVSLPMPRKLQRLLRQLAEGVGVSPREMAEAARQLGELYKRGVQDALVRADLVSVDLVGAHGQTIWHAPNDASYPLSWQLFDPWPIAHDLQTAVVFDMRQADIMAGGQGAPITPIADAVMYPMAQAQVLNLGGIANVTRWDGKSLQGADIGPCNLVLDALCEKLTGKAYDADGQMARQGCLCASRVQPVQHFLQQQAKGTQTLGREQYGASCIVHLIEVYLIGLSPEDALRTMVTAIANILVEQLCPGADVILAGGGARHILLHELLAEKCAEQGVLVSLSDDFAIPCEAREAFAFAILAAICQDKVSIYHTGVTGAASAVVGGSWVYPTQSFD